MVNVCIFILSLSLADCGCGSWEPHTLQSDASFCWNGADFIVYAEGISLNLREDMFAWLIPEIYVRKGFMAA